MKPTISIEDQMAPLGGLWGYQTLQDFIFILWDNGFIFDAQRAILRNLVIQQQCPGRDYHGSR
jgi:hypothetical protein